MNTLLTLTADQLSKMRISDWGYTESLEATSFNQLKEWISLKLNGPLKYLEGERLEKRKSLLELYPESRSALVFLFDYTETKKSLNSQNQNQKVASYTLGFNGEDYHFWIKGKLNLIGEELKKSRPGLNFKISLDIHPVLERDLAHRAGLGWFGKNSMLISKEYGSFTLIGSLILNQTLDLDIKEIESDHCGTCRRCIDACPTIAIKEGSLTIDANKCISTHTIEIFKDEKPPEGFPTPTEEIFGCDICQDVCPWNSKPLDKSVARVSDDKIYTFFNRDILEIYNDIEGMSNNEFKKFFFGTSFFRSGKRGLIKNLRPYL